MSKYLTPVQTKFRPYEIISFDEKRKPSTYPVVWVIDSLEDYLELLTSTDTDVFAIEDRCYDDEYIQLSPKQQNNSEAELSLLKYINYDSQTSGRLILIDENIYAWETVNDSQNYTLTSRKLKYLNTLDVIICEKNTPEGYITAIESTKIAFFVDTSVDTSLYPSINLIQRILTKALPHNHFLLSGEIMCWPVTLASIIKLYYLPTSSLMQSDLVNHELTPRIVKALDAVRKNNK